MKKLACPDTCTHLASSHAYELQRKQASELAEFERELKEFIGREISLHHDLDTIEEGICRACDHDPEINDSHVEQALEYFRNFGKHLLFGIGLGPSLPASRQARLVIEHIDRVFPDGALPPKSDAGFLRTRLLCLCRVLVSVNDHYEPRNNAAYLSFMQHYHPTVITAKDVEDDECSVT